MTDLLTQPAVEVAQFSHDTLILTSCRSGFIVGNRLQLYLGALEDPANNSLWDLRVGNIRILWTCSWFISVKYDFNSFKTVLSGLFSQWTLMILRVISIGLMYLLGVLGISWSWGIWYDIVTIYCFWWFFPWEWDVGRFKRVNVEQESVVLDYIELRVLALWVDAPGRRCICNYAPDDSFVKRQISLQRHVWVYYYELGIWYDLWFDLDSFWMW